ncbi:ACP S-malonyltransferase [Oscillospiraceae bacterium OttesenSCG-928-F05]|nr:ACP S-malonyltransferase [Oscillospiraceae bacterium OttesenSCG-928-F05]
MGKCAVMFSGQGAQVSGMGKALYERYAEVRAVYDRGAEILEIDLNRLGFEIDDKALQQTKYAQPAIFTMGLALSRLLEARGVIPDGYAGFSLGEVTALAAAGCVSEADGFHMIRARASAMQRAAETGGGRMVAVLGLEAEKIAEICGTVSPDVAPVNYNSPVQTVIAGTEEACALAEKALLEAGAQKCVPLAVAAAFHSPLMGGAAEEFQEALAPVVFSAPKRPLYSNVSGTVLAVENYGEYLALQMCSPVRWVDEVRTMIADGFDTFIELGPGKTLCGLIRRIDRGVTVYPTETPEAFEKMLAGIKG